MGRPVDQGRKQRLTDVAATHTSATAPSTAPAAWYCPRRGTAPEFPVAPMFTSWTVHRSTPFSQVIFARHYINDISRTVGDFRKGRGGDAGWSASVAWLLGVPPEFLPHGREDPLPEVTLTAGGEPLVQGRAEHGGGHGLVDGRH